MIFNEKKAAQVAAFFVFSSGGTINVLKLAKLMYLAERKSYEVFGEPIIGDNLVSMPHGPVLSMSLNCSNGGGNDDIWGALIAGREGYKLGLASGVQIKDPLKDLDFLSRADVRILTTIWDSFGRMNQFQLRDYTHENCPEWEDPNGSSQTIPPERLLKDLGFKGDALHNLLERNAASSAFASVFK